MMTNILTAAANRERMSSWPSHPDAQFEQRVTVSRRMGQQLERVLSAGLSSTAARLQQTFGTAGREIRARPDQRQTDEPERVGALSALAQSGRFPAVRGQAPRARSRPLLRSGIA